MVGDHHDHRDPGKQGIILDTHQNIQPAGIGQNRVKQHKTDRFPVFVELFNDLVAASGKEDIIAASEDPAQSLAVRGLLLHQKDSALFADGSVGRRCIRHRRSLTYIVD